MLGLGSDSIPPLLPVVAARVRRVSSYVAGRRHRIRLAHRAGRRRLPKEKFTEVYFTIFTGKRFSPHDELRNEDVVLHRDDLLKSSTTRRNNTQKQCLEKALQRNGPQSSPRGLILNSPVSPHPWKRERAPKYTVESQITHNP